MTKAGELPPAALVNNLDLITGFSNDYENETTSAARPSNGC